MVESKVGLVKIDPLGPGPQGLLFPYVVQRILEMAKAHEVEISGEALTREILVKLCKGDPNILVLAMVTKAGQVVGHGAAAIHEYAGLRWIFIIQCKVDGDQGDAVIRALDFTRAWGLAQGAQDLVLMGTARSDAAWARKYGFKSIRHMMILDNREGDSGGSEE